MPGRSALRLILGVSIFLVPAVALLAWHRFSPPAGQQPLFTSAPCEREALPRAAGASTPLRDLLLITVDTLRADRLGSYGYRSARTPVIDALAATGIRFEQATTPIPRTSPGIASLMTGLWPHHSGSREVAQPIGAATTLANVLCEAGYTTLAVSANRAAGPDQNFDRGFDSFLNQSANASEVNQQVIGLLEKVRGRSPLFVWVHYVDPISATSLPATGAINRKRATAVASWPS
jgi:membrane-anchored protein YejM (alkaline phosphatase superfamily)